MEIHNFWASLWARNMTAFKTQELGTLAPILSLALSVPSGKDEIRLPQGLHTVGPCRESSLQIFCLGCQFINVILNSLPTLKNWEISFRSLDFWLLLKIQKL